jgi:hypothetical protein
VEQLLAAEIGPLEVEPLELAPLEAGAAKAGPAKNRPTRVIEMAAATTDSPRIRAKRTSHLSLVPNTTPQLAFSHGFESGADREYRPTPLSEVSY